MATNDKTGEPLTPAEAEAVKGTLGDDEHRLCVNCYFWRSLNAQRKNKAIGMCLHEPPTVNIVLSQGGSPLDPKQQTVSQAPAFVRPETADDDMCSHHRFGDEMSPVEIVATELQAIAQMFREASGTPPKQGR